MEDPCIFCELAKQAQNFVDESELCYALWDIKPITKGHILIITKKHFRNLSSTDDKYLQDAISLVKKMSHKLKEIYPDIKGFRYLSNEEKAANQVVFHLHIHIIPKY